MRHLHRGTAYIMADSNQDYHVTRGLRNLIRLALVVLVMGLVVGFTAGKYLSDDNLAKSTTTKREENVSLLTADQIEVAQCPCQNETFKWSKFVRVREPLTNNNTQLAAFCGVTLVPELGTMSNPTSNSTTEYNNTYATYVEQLNRNVASEVICVRIANLLLASTDPNPSHISLGDEFYSTELLSERQVRLRLYTFIGQLIFREQSATLEQLERGQYILNEVNSLLNNSSPDASSQSSSAYAFNLYQNKSAGALKALEDTIHDSAYYDRFLGALRGAMLVEYQDYTQACGPYYCDYTTKKSAWSRVTEFLGLLGGLYTTFLALGATFWIVIGRFLPI